MKVEPLSGGTIFSNDIKNYQMKMMFFEGKVRFKTRY